MGNLTNDTPPKKGFWTPPRTVRFPPPSGVSALFFLYKNPRQSRPEALLEGSKNFWESVFYGTFSSPHAVCTPPYHGPIVGGVKVISTSGLEGLVALYRAMRLRCGYGFESCDANGPRNVKNTNIAKHRPIFLPPLLLVGSKELVLKVPIRGQFHTAIRVTRKRCDSCAQAAQGTRTVSRRNF